ncbi:hypothetical protein ZIOFF_031399 [Zingiber officinale]|uniref:GB1/RHD3-type G domain-containing protein n=1 Tax=Zingiber officinale TaxID=94328 RepID=A0A8J5GD38_ZINOF|nr:hypothetical protein ZIOFF_031399 [Zingiber officinale]
MGSCLRVVAFWLVIFGWSLSCGTTDDPVDLRRTFPIVEPDSEHTKLRIAREGLEAIKKITNPIASVVVIGPYRSGKSFLLNQLLSLSCDEGFGVGHMRDTKTKGIWVWGTPVEMDFDGRKISVLYVDTEGFESVGKSNVYDDRIFALATIISSVLIYNLPETVFSLFCFGGSCYRFVRLIYLGYHLLLKLQKSFTEEKGKGTILLLTILCFGGDISCSFSRWCLIIQGQDVAFEPAKLLWLIQRDFLQGKSVQEMVNEALQHVPNSSGQSILTCDFIGNRNIDQVNQIRESLKIMGDNNTAFSLPQPHLQRTKLCDLKDNELDQLYVKKREQLKQLVASIIRPKLVQGKFLNGNDFVDFLEQILEALNKGEIPSTGSIVEAFNKVILERCLKLYGRHMDSLQLPVEEKRLQEVHEESKFEAKKLFDHQHFGRNHAEQSILKLDDEINKVLRTLILINEHRSSKLCEAQYTKCEDKMDSLQVMRLPSMAKFNNGFLRCNQTFERECIGPSKEMYKKKMTKMLSKAQSLFIKDYNQRLCNLLVAFSLIVAIVGRFIVKFILFELAGWIMFIFLETYTRLFWSSESLYYNPAWHAIISTWETIVYSPILDLDRQMGNSNWCIASGTAPILALFW